MRQKKISVWILAILCLGFLLFSGSFAFASFPVGWVFQIPQDMSRLPPIGFSSEPSLPQMAQANRSAVESYFFEYEAWRRIRSSA